MYYKRYRKRRYSSKVVKMKFQSFFDLSTQDGQMQIISINAGGKQVLQRLGPMFAAYKYYKLGSVSFKLLPASTLPIDPTGLSYEEGENTVDPRDQMTPGMCRITNGEDILEDITGMSEENQHSLYNNMLLDPRWFKWMLQSGVKRSGSPRYWQIGQLHQDKWPGAFLNLPAFNGTSGQFEGTKQLVRDIKGYDVQAFTGNGSSQYGIFQTGHKGRLGWMPTDSFQRVLNGSQGSFTDIPMLASIPEIELFKILMPPAYKTKFYYRAFVTETVYFKEPVVMNINQFKPLDVFHNAPVPGPKNPSTADTSGLITDAVYGLNTGGNDGNS